MNFCSNCGAKVALRVPPGDSLPRHVCDNCNTIHYRNPLVVVGTIPDNHAQSLLCQRRSSRVTDCGRFPRFMELGETTAQGR
jgi:hypothetical protein